MTRKPDNIGKVGTEGLGLFADPTPDSRFTTVSPCFHYWPDGAGTPCSKCGEPWSTGAAYYEPRCRASDPETSRSAAESMVDAAQDQRNQILAYLEAHAGGAIADKLDEALGWRSSTAGRRLSELIETGQVIRCDGLRQGAVHPPKLMQRTRQGRWAYIHLRRVYLAPEWLVGEDENR